MVKLTATRITFGHCQLVNIFEWVGREAQCRTQF